MGPLVNTRVANARVIVPDGSSLLQLVGSPAETHWFVFGVEPGKTYAVEVVDPASDLVANTIGCVTASDGAVGRRRRRSSDRTLNLRAPALQVASDGMRCILRTFPPSWGSAEQARDLCGGDGGDGAELPDPGAGEHDLRPLDEQWLTTFTSSCRTRRRTRFARR